MCENLFQYSIGDKTLIESCNVVPCLSVYDVFSWDHMNNAMMSYESDCPGCFSHRLRGWSESIDLLPDHWVGITWSDMQTTCQYVPDVSTKIHDSGWEITGHISGTNYMVVYIFEAKHPIHGWVKGDTRTIVTCSSEEALKEFCKHFPFILYNPLSE